MSAIKGEIDKALSRHGYFVEFEDNIHSGPYAGDIYIQASYERLSASYRGTRGSFDIEGWKILPVRDHKRIPLDDALGVLSLFVSDNVLSKISRMNIDKIMNRRQRYGV